MIDIDKQAEVWAAIKYSETHLDENYFSKATRKKILKYFDELGISESYMDGHSIEGLPKLPASEGSGGLNMSSIFHELVNSGDVSPGLYLAKYIEVYLNKGLNEDRLLGFLARALRSFGSFLREPDLAFKLQASLKKSYSTVTIDMDPDQDTKKHVDIVVTFDETIFNIWSYQASSRGIPNTLDRLSGSRGVIMDGINVLCPLKTEDGLDLLKIRTSLEKKKLKLDSWHDEQSKSPTPGRQKKLEELITKNEKVYSEKLIEESKLAINLEKELEIKSGWFLHSDNYVQEVSSMLIKYKENEHTPIDYNELQHMILTPRELIRDINIIVK